MKRALILLSLLGVVVDGCSQALVNFNNNVIFSTPGNRTVYDLCGGRLVGTNWAAQLYYGASGATTLVPVMALPARFRPSWSIEPGTWAGGLRTLTGFNPGARVTLQVRVWDASFFPTFEQAAAAGAVARLSSPFQYTIPPAGSHPSAYYIENFRGMAPSNLPPAITIEPASGSRVRIVTQFGRLQRATTLSPPDWQDVSEGDSNCPSTNVLNLTEKFVFFRAAR